MEVLARRLRGKRVYALPDVADTSDLASAADADVAVSPFADYIRRLAAGRRIIGCYGQFSKRKGAREFIMTAECCRDEPWFFVWVGEDERASFPARERRQINAYLAAEASNSYIRLGRIEREADYNALVRQADILFLCYRNHPGSSNMLGKAAAFGKPVLVTGGFAMAEEARRFDLGLCVPPNASPVTYRDAIRRLLSGTAVAPRYEEYEQAHSAAGFNAVVREMALIGLAESGTWASADEAPAPA